MHLSMHEYSLQISWSLLENPNNAQAIVVIPVPGLPKSNDMEVAMVVLTDSRFGARHY